MHEALDSIHSSAHRPFIVVHTSHSRETEVGGSEVQGHPQLHSEFETHMALSLKKKVHENKKWVHE